MARDTYSSITDLIRQTADDRDQAGGQVWPDEDLSPFVSAALLDLNLMLVNAGSQLAKKYAVLNLPAGSTTINFVTQPNTNNLLPEDVLTPLMLWEKAPGDPDREYREMDETEERLPDVDVQNRLRYWMWTQSTDSDSEGMALVTLGCTADRTIRIQYFCQFPEFTGNADQAIPVPGARTLLAYDGLKRAALARGEIALVEYVDPMYKEAWDRFRRMHVKAGQRRARRRIPYGMKRPYRF